ncbi:het-domain-containing protein [Fusarium flagelliforme]|uniref:Het-domain-containing protein n=1 Tax=Fusarium flagelliforme TaxID=2675880 RepID=A0A395N1E4_9HYPO|nr:het-domain-containing protein [Fusarium flagelliforme]
MRIIRIDSEGETIRLIETNESDEGVYAALSHCWGPPGVHPVRTTGDTISKYKDATPISELTAVFQDAIWLCKQLHVYDIWIDSLCIIQDDSHDWVTESSKMAQYYSNARFTIAVERSWDSNTHFLRDAEDRWQPLTYSTTDHNGHPVRYTIREHYSHEAYLEGLSNYFKRGKEILLSRGWGLQEAFLSTRLIHFTPSDVMLECRRTRGYFDAYHRHDSPGQTIRERLTRLETWPAWLLSEPVPPAIVLSRQESIHKIWTALINEYTLRTLSFQEDKLPAFGGIASYFTQYFSGRYLAGIWEGQIHVGLCWKVVDTGQTAVRSLALEEPTVPSWSWACLPVGVGVEGRETPIADNFNQNSQVIIHQAECQLSSPNAPFGRVSGGYILLEAPLYKVQIGCVSLSPKHPDWIQHTITWDSDAELSFEPTITFRHDTLLAVQDGKVTKATSGRQLEYLTDVSSFQGTAWVVLLVGLKNDVEGLVLGQVGNGPVYQRLGHVRMSVAHKEMKAPSRALIRIV